MPTSSRASSRLLHSDTINILLLLREDAIYYASFRRLPRSYKDERIVWREPVYKNHNNNINFKGIKSRWNGFKGRYQGFGLQGYKN